jgi:hypothetical protein
MWKDLILPSVLRFGGILNSLVNQLTILHRTVRAQFKMIPKETLGLLRSLNSENRLATTGTNWKHELGDLVREYISAWVLNEEWVCNLIQ